MVRKSLLSKEQKEYIKNNIELIKYNKTSNSRNHAKNLEETFPKKTKPGVNWLNINGIKETEIITTILSKYKIHPLVIEDVLQKNERPKIEIFDNYIFILLKSLTFDERKLKLNHEQISIILTKDNIISIQERPGDLFTSIRKNIEENRSIIRKMGSDYLMYSMLDNIIDYYFNIIEKIGDSIEKLEEGLMNEPKSEMLNEIYRLKKEIMYLRKAVWPLREAISKIERTNSKLIHKQIKPYLRDVYEHTIQIIDTIETSRDLISGMLDLYLSSNSNKMNEVMKVLTVISTIFIPLTFITGVYGMNFNFMPELTWKFGYFLIWGIMVIIIIGMRYYFKKKDWWF